MCFSPAVFARMKDYLSLVTFSHTVFALPFALLGYTLGVLSPEGAFRWVDLLLVVICMVTARNAAMGFNRLVDAPIDAQNERTATRDIPAGRVSPRAAAWFVAINCLLFVGSAGLLNTLCLWLSPVALAVVLGYSYTKRFTWLCHAVLGLGLALAPVGSYLAVTGSFSVTPVLLGAVIICWVAGFDIVYALQDEAFDRRSALHSVPVRFGLNRSIGLSRTLHILSLILLAIVSWQLISTYPAAWLYVAAGWIVFAIALVYQHRIVGRGDLSRIDRAFFTTNGLASAAYASVLISGLLLT